MTNKNDKWNVKSLPSKDFKVQWDKNAEEKPQSKQDKDEKEEDISKYCDLDSPTAD